MAMIQPYNQSGAAGSGAKNAGHSGSQRPKDMDKLTTKDMEFADMLRNYVLNHKASAIKPRGLSNRSNWCFVNAILQALLACPPFYNLMKGLPSQFLGNSGKNVASIVSSANDPTPAAAAAAGQTPEPAVAAAAAAAVANSSSSSHMKILRAVHTFFAEFSPMEHFPKLNRKRKSEDFPQGKVLEPTSIYNYLLNLSPTETFKVVEGRQEDAEEFLTFLLNGLNDEMLALFKRVDQETTPPPTTAAEEAEQEGADEEEGDEDEWQEVGPKNRSVVTRRAGGTGAGSANRSKPPLAEIFQGQMRSCLQPCNGEPTATLQPFFNLQLDIQSEKVGNVTEALANNFASEIIDGYLCPKTKQEVEAVKSMSLEELPPILVLHLKRFVYDGSGKGSQKLLKNIDFPVGKLYLIFITHMVQDVPFLRLGFLNALAFETSTLGHTFDTVTFSTFDYPRLGTFDEMWKVSA